MRRTISSVLLTAVAAAVLLCACSRVPEQSRHIPKTAGFVMGINSKQISQKLLTSGITMDKLFTALQDNDTSNPARKAWKNAEQSGLDLQENFFLSVVFNNSQQSYVSITGGVKDAAKLEAYLKKEWPEAALKTKNDFQYAWEEKEQTLLGWNKGTFILLHPMDAAKLKKGAMGLPNMPVPGEEEENEEAVADSAIASPVRQVLTEGSETENAWVAEADRLFHLKNEESAGTIAAFKTLLKGNADMSVFVNPEPIYTTQATMLPANLKNLLAECYYTAGVNFENGKVVMDGITYIGKEMSAIYKKYGRQEADLSMLEKYPSGNLTAWMAYSLDLRMIGDIIRSMGMDGIVNMTLNSSGVNMDDLLNAFKGQMVMVASDFAIERKESEYFPGDSITKTGYKWLFSMKVGDKAAFDKVMNAPMMKGFFKKEGNSYVPAGGIPGVMPMSITDKLVTIASDSALLQQYLAGSGKAALDKDFMSKVKGNQMGAYINFEKIMGSIPESELPEDGRPLAKQAKDLLKDMEVVSEPFDGNTQRFQGVLHFRNQQENSLVQLVNMGVSTAKYMQEKQKREEEAAAAADAGYDSTAVPEDTATPAH